MRVDQNHPEAPSLIPLNINDSELIKVNTEKIWLSIFIFNKVLTNIVASVQFLEIAATRWKTPLLHASPSERIKVIVLSICVQPETAEKLVPFPLRLLT